MNKLFLIGGEGLSKYSVADVLWTIINSYSDIKFDFSMKEIENIEDLESFLDEYRKNPEYIGFNVALPWKEVVANKINDSDTTENTKIINTAYKDKNKISTVNTDVIGIKESLDYSSVDFNAIQSVLILGLGGAGKATCEFLSNHKKIVFCYDIKASEINNPEIKVLNSLEDIVKNPYDLIINATPLGKYYLETPINAFSAPLDGNLLKEIIKPTTILQDMNYFPQKTLFLQMGDLLGLKTISGDLMLIFQALASYKKYFKKELPKQQIQSIITEMTEYIELKEKNLFKLNIN